MADFHHSAFNIHIQVVDNDVLLKAALKTTDGQVNYDTIKLNEHIKNDHGKFAWGGRDFHKTAEELTLEHKPHHKPVLMGWLGDGNHGKNYVSIVLSDKIGNDNGKFVVSS